MKKKVIIGLFLASCMFLFLTGCASDDSGDWAADMSVEASAAVAEVDSVDASDDDAEMELFMREEYVNETEEEPIFGSRPMLLASESGRQLSYTVSLFIETEDFMEGIRILWETISRLEGYAVHESIRGTSLHNPGRERSARFELRIPNERLSEFLEIIEDHFNMVEYENDLDDFTFTYERQTAQLDSLRAQEDRLLADLEDDDAERDDIEDNLSDIQSQIRNLEESTIIIQRNVDYSDVSIRLNEVIIVVLEEEIPEEPVTFGERLRETLDGTLDVLVTTLQVLMVVLVTVLPWMILIGMVILPVVYVVNKIQKKTGKVQKLNEQHLKNNVLFEKKSEDND